VTARLVVLGSSALEKPWSRESARTFADMLCEFEVRRAGCRAVLVELRKEKGRNQSELATAVGINQSAWSKVERGASALTIEQPAEVGAQLGTAPGEILERADRLAESIKSRGIQVENKRTSCGTWNGIVASKASPARLRWALDPKRRTSDVEHLRSCPISGVLEVVGHGQVEKAKMLALPAVRWQPISWSGSRPTSPTTTALRPTPRPTRRVVPTPIVFNAVVLWGLKVG
jgi:transcriptional regulator with XRE-family HTH domain